MAELHQHDYVLHGGMRGAERLRLLAEVKWPTTSTLLERVGLRAGMHCLDVGCGIGAVTLKIAERVGSAGRVVGVDLDADCLALARAEARRLGLCADFRQATANDVDESAAFDLVYARFLLTHLRDPQAALARMLQATRPGGVLAVEDIQFTGHFSHPVCPAFDRYVDLYQQVVRRKGGDPNIGPRLPGLFLDSGLTPEFEVIQPTYLQGPGKSIAGVTMEHIREAVVSAGLATDAEIDAILAELRTFADNPRTLLSLPRIFQVWATRP